MGSEAICVFSCKNISRVVSFTHQQNIICSQTQLDDIAHEQTIICRQLFAGHVAGFQPMKRKKNLHRMIISFIVLQFSHIILYYSLLNSPGWLNMVTGNETGLTSQLGSIVRTLFTYNTNRNTTVNYPFCSPQQSLNNLQYHKTIKNSTTKSTLCTSWRDFLSRKVLHVNRNRNIQKFVGKGSTEELA